jgi:hypothetical protein
MFTTAPAQAESTATSHPATKPPVAQPDEVRLGAIAYRLATANGDRCSQPEMMTGLILHDLAGYDAVVRPQVARVYGLGAGFGVRLLVPGSSADRAGLRRGDEIVALDGQDLIGFAAGLIARRATPERTERFTDLLADALRQGPATLSVRRGGALLSLSLSGEKGCGGRVLVSPSGELNAWTDGRYVAVTRSMMRFAKDDPELAFVVAHEMAHVILGHPEGHGARGKSGEADADSLAIELMARADYDLTAPARLLRRTAWLQLLSLNFSHPGTGRRVGIVKASVMRLDHAVGPVAAGCAAAPAAERDDASVPNACAGDGDLPPPGGSIAAPPVKDSPAGHAPGDPHSAGVG